MKLIAASVVLWAFSAFSLVSVSRGTQIDWSEGFIGIYSENSGVGVCLPDTLSPVNLYIVLETEEIGVSGFQAGIQKTSGVYVTDINFGCDAINFGTNGDILVGYTEPKPVIEGKVVLAEITVIPLNSGGLSLAATSGVDVVAFLNPTNNIIRPDAAYGGFGLELPMFTFGTLECPEEQPHDSFDPVATESLKWGSIKALYSRQNQGE